MPFLMLKDLPRYECLMEAAKEFPELNPSASAAYLNLLRTGDEVIRVVERYLAEHNISQGRFSVLMLLWRFLENTEATPKKEACHPPGPRTPAELAQAAGVTRATMTGLIDTLERDGFVHRKPDVHDRRMMSVQLTEHGKEFMRKLIPGHFRMIAALMETLTEVERKTIVALLSKIQKQAAALTRAES